MANPHYKAACESVDACVFSGDMLGTRESLDEFEKYVQRWQRAIEENRQTLNQFEAEDRENEHG